MSDIADALFVEGATPESGVGSARALTLPSLAQQIFDDVKAAAVERFRATDAGQDIEREATRQKVRELVRQPIVWIVGAVVILGLAQGVRAMFRE